MKRRDEVAKIARCIPNPEARDIFIEKYVADLYFCSGPTEARQLIHAARMEAAGELMKAPILWVRRLFPVFIVMTVMPIAMNHNAAATSLCLAVLAGSALGLLFNRGPNKLTADRLRAVNNVAYLNYGILVALGWLEFLFPVPRFVTFLCIGVPCFAFCLSSAIELGFLRPARMKVSSGERRIVAYAGLLTLISLLNMLTLTYARAQSFIPWLWPSVFSLSAYLPVASIIIYILGMREYFGLRRRS